MLSTETAMVISVSVSSHLDNARKCFMCDKIQLPQLVVLGSVQCVCLTLIYELSAQKLLFQ